MKRAAWAMAALLVGMILLFALALGTARWELIGYFALFSLALLVSLFLLIRRDVADAVVNWRGPLFFIFLSILAPVAFQPAMVSVLDSTLRQFRVGGGVPVRVERFDGATAAVEGRLLLLGKRNLYIEIGAGNARPLIVVANSQNLKVTIGQRQGVQ